MGLQFYLGRSGTGKTTNIVKEIRQKIIEDRLGSPIIYIVPDQMSFQAETELIGDEQVNGSMRAQVYSFTRLAWLVLGETGGMSRKQINKVGIHMILQKILIENRERLQLYRNSCDKQGFITQLDQLFTEYKRYCVTPEHLLLAVSNEQSPMLRAKLSDFALLYENFELELAGKYVASEDYFNLLAEKIPQSNYLKNATIYVDGFHGFTQLEKNILAQLILHTQNVKIALTLDQQYKHAKPEEHDLFRMTGETYFDLYKLANEMHVQIEEDVEHKYNYRFQYNEAAAHLEENFSKRPGIEFHEETAFTVIAAKNRRVEIEQIAMQIIKHVREGFRYRDIIVLTRDGDQYTKLLETIFKDYQIPVFIDQKKPMMFHPLIELVSAALDSVESDFAYDPMFRAFKTDLFFESSHRIQSERDFLSKLDNYVLSRGIRGNKWDGEWIFKLNRGLELEKTVQSDAELSFQALLNSFKNMLYNPIQNLSKKIKKAKTVSDYVQALIWFLEVLQVNKKIEKWMKHAESSGELVLAKQHKQAWEELVRLFEQLIETNGDMFVDFATLKQMIEAGIESLKFSLVPPSLDQVILGNLDVSKPQKVKIAFIIGLNEGVLPKKINESGILTEEDREKLSQSGIQLAPSAITTLFDEEFVAYTVFNLASKKTYFTYPIADGEGKSLFPSGYIKRITALFPKIHIVTASDLVSDCKEIEGQLNFVNHTAATIQYLAQQIQAYKENEEIHPLWWDVYNEFTNDCIKKDAVAFVLSSLNYQNVSENLNKATVDQLYGETIKGSVSRIELYNRCPFSYFSKYGLKLQEREVFTFDAPAIGTFFHETIKHVADTLEANNLSWSELDKAKCDALASEAADRIAPLMQNEILFSTERMKYLKHKFSQIIQKTAFTMNQHAQKSTFTPFGFEVPFGTADSSLPSLEIPLQDGKKMELNGRIDRIDSALHPTTGKRYVAVIDYKSGTKNIDYSEVYYGIALQMFTYLNVLLKHSDKVFQEKAHPAGLLYFRLQNPLLKEKDTLSDAEALIDEKRLKQFKLNGLVSDEKEIISLFDNDFESTSKSDVVPVALKKDGSFSTQSKVASSEQIKLLTEHVTDIYKKSGNEILSGKTEIKPYKLKQNHACTYCDFKPVCQFDPSLKENKYHFLQSMKINEAIHKIQPGGGEVE
ncbi:MAG: addB [Bacillales bacterium]|jgi:ATP-dependent helicase/nuclease subunit B|nr:addB [Bacillales bacterium]